MNADESSSLLSQAMSRSGMNIDELWLRHVAVGGYAGELEVEAYVLGLLVADPHQHDVIAQALNEHFLENGQDHPVEYWDG